MPKVLIAPQTLAHLEAPYLDVLRQAGFEIAYPPKAEQLSVQELLEQLPGAAATIAGSVASRATTVISGPFRLACGTRDRSRRAPARSAARSGDARPCSHGR
jgi:hypothetical protein